MRWRGLILKAAGSSSIHCKASQMVLADKVLHALRQQQRLIDRPGPEGLAYKRSPSHRRANFLIA